MAIYIIIYIFNVIIWVSYGDVKVVVFIEPQLLRIKI